MPTMTADAFVVEVATALPGVTCIDELVVGACCAPASGTDPMRPAARNAIVVGVSFMSRILQ